MTTTLMSRALLDGIIYALITCAVIILSLYWNPRIWIQDFPKVMRDRIPPLDSQEKRQRLVFGLILMTLIFGLPVIFAAQWKSGQATGSTFGELYLYMAVLLMLYNLGDALIVDLLLITIMQPKRLRVPGTEDLAYVLRNPWFHISAFLKGIVFCAVGALILAGLASLL